MRYLFLLLFIISCSSATDSGEPACGDQMSYAVGGDATNVTVRGRMNNETLIEREGVNLPWESEPVDVEPGDHFTLSASYPEGPGSMEITFMMEGRRIGDIATVFNGSDSGKSANISYTLSKAMIESTCN